eukprot:8864661-Pyramimonas_sp.AAC.1
MRSCTAESVEKESSECLRLDRERRPPLICDGSGSPRAEIDRREEREVRRRGTPRTTLTLGWIQINFSPTTKHALRSILIAGVRYLFRCTLLRGEVRRAPDSIKHALYIVSTLCNIRYRVYIVRGTVCVVHLDEDHDALVVDSHLLRLKGDAHMDGGVGTAHPLRAVALKHPPLLSCAPSPPSPPSP